MSNLKSIRTWYRQEKENLQFFKGSWRYVFVWPILGTVLAGSLWGITLSRLEKERLDVQSKAAVEVLSLSQVYAKQIERSIEQLDELTLYVKTDWERTGGTLRIDKLHQRGLFSTNHFLSFLIIGPDGTPLSSTLQPGKGLTFSDREYFQFHKTHKERALRVGMPTIGRLSGKRVIHLTRRLENADGSFAGVMVVGMPLEFFAPFSNAPLFGKSGLLALVGDDGRVRVTGVGGEVNRAAQVTMLHMPNFAHQMWAPVTEPAANAPRVLDADWFSDRERRIVASTPLSRYPFRTLVALSEDEYYLPYVQARAEVIRGVTVGSFILSFFVLAAMLLSARLLVRKAQEAESRTAYRLATEGGNEGFYLWKALRDRDGQITDFRVIDCNERGAELYSRTKDQLLSQTLTNLYPADCAASLLDLHRDAFLRGFHEGDFEVPEGSSIMVDWIHQKMVRTHGGLAITWRDVTQLRTNQVELARLANEDALTGLPNRYWMTNNLPGMLERTGENGTSLAVLFIDLDNFKNVNDSLGHSAGDALLRAAAARLRSIVRPSDRVVRLGGDEFTVILDPVADPEQVAQVASRIVKAFKEPFELEQGSNFVGTSIGIGMFPADGQDAETLTKNADIAMYSAKVRKGEFCFYQQHMFERFRNRINIEQELQSALDEDQFQVYYQPRADTQTGKVVGLEALVRWIHPVRGLVLPGEFVPAAEETGHILKLGALVLRKTCAQIAQWRDDGFPTVPVSVNVSARQFNQSNVQQLLADCLLEFGLDPDQVEIELTESTMMEEGEDVLNQLAEIDAMGVKLHVDDFGTGHSSLALLQQLQLDVLKIDRAFTCKLGTSSEGEIFFRAILSMAHALGMSVVAEGVETEEQLRVLQRLGCDEIQGFYLSQPVPASEVVRLVRQASLFPAPSQEPCIARDSAEVD